MRARKRIAPGWPWDDDFNMSQAIEIGNTIYVSGQVSMDSAGNVVGPGDMQAQTRQALENIKTVLESAGSSMADVVKITTYLTDISTYADFAKARTEAFPGGVPASTAVATPALVMPELLVEVEAMAVIGSGS